MKQDTLQANLMKLRVHWYGQVLCLENVRQRYEEQLSTENTKDWVETDIMLKNNWWINETEYHLCSNEWNYFEDKLLIGL